MYVVGSSPPPFKSMRPSITDQVRVSDPPLIRQGKPPAIVIGCGVTLTAVLRLLHQADIPAYSVCISSGDFSRYSRWSRQLPGLYSTPVPSELPQILDNLSLESAVLFPCSDDWLTATAKLPERLAHRYPSSVAALPSCRNDGKQVALRAIAATRADSSSHNLPARLRSTNGISV